MDLKCGGVSVKGRHEKNQDSYLCRRFEWGAAAVVSDGLGSRVNSDAGAQAICAALAQAADSARGVIADTDSFLPHLHELIHAANPRERKRHPAACDP